MSLRFKTPRAGTPTMPAAMTSTLPIRASRHLLRTPRLQLWALPPFDRYAMVAVRAPSSIVGVAELRAGTDGDGTLELRCDVVPDCRNRGYATEVAVALVELAFARGTPQLAACTPDGHGAAARVAQKAGLRLASVGEAGEPGGWRWRLVNPSA